MTTVGLGSRLVLTQKGRTTQSLSLAGDSRLLRPRTIDDLADEGRLSVLSGREIHHVFRAQVPVVPYLSTQASLLRIDLDKTYLITDDRALFEQMLDVLDSVRVYENNRLAFNGVLYPKALVLESPLSKKSFQQIPIQFPSLENLESNRYVLLETTEAFNRFINNHEPSETVNLILPESGVLRDSQRAAEFVRNVNSFSILGQTAIRARPGLNLFTANLLLIPEDFPSLTNPAGNWFSGSFEAPSHIFYLNVLPVLMAALGFLGLIMRGYPLRWGLWAFIGLIAYFFVPNWHLFLAGLVTAGLVQFGLRLRGVSVPWFILAGAVGYSFAFQPYLVDPFYGIRYFWIGFLVGMLTTLSGWSERIKKNPTYGDVIALVLGGAVLGIAVLTFYGQATLGQSWVAITLLPAAVSLITAVNRPRHWPWMTGMAAWFILFHRSGYTGIFFVFLLSMAGWIIIEKTRRFITSGPTGRRPI